MDGIFVNDNNQTITVFQSRILQKADRTLGDGALQSSLAHSPSSSLSMQIQNLIAAAGAAQVGNVGEAPRSN